MIFYASFLSEYRAELYAREHFILLFVGIQFPDESIESFEVKTEVQIMNESFLGVTDIDESGIQCRKEFLDLAKIHVPDRIALTLG